MSKSLTKEKLEELSGIPWFAYYHIRHLRPNKGKYWVNAEKITLLKYKENGRYDLIKEMRPRRYVWITNPFRAPTKILAKQHLIKYLRENQFYVKNTAI